MNLETEREPRGKREESDDVGHGVRAARRRDEREDVLYGEEAERRDAMNTRVTGR